MNRKQMESRLAQLEATTGRAERKWLRVVTDEHDDETTRSSKFAAAATAAGGRPEDFNWLHRIVVQQRAGGDQ